eukprot:CAMPEP_0174856686 /NCGR_PEP_ID=MMETSP1114-20130205/36166_1 /TAXON_ID=312471 /ORGANISM="Neobodo designis, Strain CCAP 1951/1" /LENGTH=490 /DNA_ID=CAMNT_0016091491 /DNA_START=41 /DNA_END=1513 /DNA_ORIENTATION=-
MLRKPSFNVVASPQKDPAGALHSSSGSAGSTAARALVYDGDGDDDAALHAAADGIARVEAASSSSVADLSPPRPVTPPSSVSASTTGANSPVRATATVAAAVGLVPFAFVASPARVRCVVPGVDGSGAGTPAATCQTPESSPTPDPTGDETAHHETAAEAVPVPPRVDGTPQAESTEPEMPTLAVEEETPRVSDGDSSSHVPAATERAATPADEAAEPEARAAAVTLQCDADAVGETAVQQHAEVPEASPSPPRAEPVEGTQQSANPSVAADTDARADQCPSIERAGASDAPAEPVGSSALHADDATTTSVHVAAAAVDAAAPTADDAPDEPTAAPSPTQPTERGNDTRARVRWAEPELQVVEPPVYAAAAPVEPPRAEEATAPVPPQNTDEERQLALRPTVDVPARSANSPSVLARLLAIISAMSKILRVLRAVRKPVVSAAKRVRRVPGIRHAYRALEFAVALTAMLVRAAMYKLRLHARAVKVRLLR